MNPNLNTSRAPLLAALRKAFRFASASTKNNTPSADELIKIASRKHLERRRLLSNAGKAGIAIGAAGLVAACKKATDLAPVFTESTNNFFNRASLQPNIAIIGAGMAGLNCAYQLKKAGITSTIYEGSTRSGGRIFTANNIMAPDLTTELGGEFIDSNHRDMLSLCSEFNLPLLDLSGESETSFINDSYFFKGRFYSTKEVIEAFKPYAAQIQADIDSLPDTINFNNYGSAKQFDKLSISEYFDSIDMHGWIRNALEIAYLTEYGREADEQSSINFLFLFSPDTSKGNFDIFGSSDERYKIKGGNQKLTNALYQQVKQNVHFDNKLVKIKEKNNGTYTLSFSCGASIKEVAADIVVSTIPFTALRLAEIDVRMPQWKFNAIHNLGYGTNSKLMLGFTKRVWRDYKYSGYLFSDGAVQNGWDNSLLQAGNNGGFTAFLGGKAGLELGLDPPATQATKFVSQLNKIWPGCKAAYNGNAERMFWPAYPFTLGSYACYTPGQWTTIAGAERRNIRNLLFAGEHCSLNFQGFMNGAAQTGRKAAEEILTSLKSGKQIQNRSEDILATIAG